MIKPIGLLIIVMWSCISVFGQNTSKHEDQLYIEFLEEFLNNGVVSSESSELFFQRSFAYWGKNIPDYVLNPEKYEKIMSLFHQCQEKFTESPPIMIDRFEKDIENYRRFDNRNTLAENPILFVGSSSIVYWETAIAFPEFPIINRGFGGASLPEIVFYYEDIIKKHSPSIMVLYCDIDIERGKSPEIAIEAFRELISMVSNDFPSAQILILSMKPTLIDELLGKEVRNNKKIANNGLKEYCDGAVNLHFVDLTKSMFKSDGTLRADIFLSDGMHLNELGYSLWNPVISNKLEEITN